MSVSSETGNAFRPIAQPLFLSPDTGMQQSSRLVALCVATAVCTLVFWMLVAPSKEIGFAGAGAIAVVAIIAGFIHIRANPKALIAALLLIDAITGAYFLPDALRSVAHYGLDFLFCFSVFRLVWRSKLLSQGNFRLYVLYLGWAWITVFYSVAPAFSASRLVLTTLMFCAVAGISIQVTCREDITKVLGYYLVGCAVLLAILGVIAVALPHDVGFESFWDSEGAGGTVERFHGLFDSPNLVGEFMLAAVGASLACWKVNRGIRSIAIVAIIASSVGFAVLAQSRSPLVAIIVGASLYLVWQYRMRGMVILLALILAFSVGAKLDNKGFTKFSERGDVTTLTGRTEVWSFVKREIASRPILGYGYEIEGQIYQDRYFPLWWGPWDLGPRSSVHEGYMSRALGVGIPATILWLFIVLRPWIWLFRQKEDPWDLKRLAFLIVIPILILTIDETVGECRGPAGLLLAFAWMIAERYRLLALQKADQERRKQMELLPSAVVALVAARH